jgi:glycosyltransferase involved in cell wall biosynthesis
MKSQPKVTILSHSDIAGGGGTRAAFRLHRALLSKGAQSRMRVAEKVSDLHTVEGSDNGKIGRLRALVRPSLGGNLMFLQKSPDANLHSMALLPSGLVDELNRSEADVLNLHWINKEFVSIEDIGRLRKPLVWTLHDMWAFSGAEHQSSDDESARWQVGYRADNRPPGHGRLDLDRWVWRRKRKAWLRPMHIVAPSRWLAECARKSILMRDWPVTVIPNLLDTRQFQPWPKEQARALLGLPATATLLLFGAFGGIGNPNKGWDLLKPALESLAAQQFAAEAVIFGQSEPAIPPSAGLPLRWMGCLNDEVTLALIYSAADVMVVPSRQESFGQTASEAQACGCPVVAFDCTGLTDVVVHGETGYLAKPYDIEDLANGIRWVLQDAERRLCLGATARHRAVQLWSPEAVVPEYLKVYQAAMESYRG